MTSSTLRFDHLQHQFEENPRRHFVPLAHAFLRAGNAHRAVELCRTFLPQLPGHVSGHVVLAEALRALGAADDARAEYERVLALDAENLVAVRALGDLAAARGSTMEARGWYARLVELDARDPDAVARLDELTRAAAEPVAPPYDAVAGDELDERQQAIEAEAAPFDDASPGLGDPSSAEEFTAGFFASVLDEPTDAPGGRNDDARFASDLDHLLPADALPGADELHATLAGTPRDAAPTDAAPRALTSVSPFEADERGGPLAPFTFDEVPAQDAPPAMPERVADEPPPAPAATPIMEEFPEDEAAAADLAPESGPTFVTETMAELYLRQGFRAEALDVYRQLLAASPHDERLHALVADLARPAAPTPDAPMAAVPADADHDAGRGDVGLEEPAPAEADPEEAWAPFASEPQRDEGEGRGDAAAFELVEPDHADHADDAPLAHDVHDVHDVPDEPAGAFTFGSGGMVEGVAGVEDRTWALAEASPAAPTVGTWLSSLVAGEELPAVHDVAPAAVARELEAEPAVQPTAESAAPDALDTADDAAHDGAPEPAVAEIADEPAAEAADAGEPSPEWADAGETSPEWADAAEPSLEWADAYAPTVEPEPARAEPAVETPAGDEDGLGGAWADWSADSLLPEQDAAVDLDAPDAIDAEERGVPELADTVAAEPPADDLVPLGATGAGVAPAGEAAPRDAEIEGATTAAGDASWDDPFAWDEPAEAPSAPASAEPFSLDELFARAADPADESAAGALAAASAGLAGDDDARGVESSAAGDAAGLGALLRATPPGVPASGAAPPPTASGLETPARGSSFSFEQFFRPTPAAGGPAAPSVPARPPAAEPPPERDDDLDEFHRWLEGLSKS